MPSIKQTRLPKTSLKQIGPDAFKWRAYVPLRHQTALARKWLVRTLAGVTLREAQRQASQWDAALFETLKRLDAMSDDERQALASAGNAPPDVLKGLANLLSAVPTTYSPADDEPPPSDVLSALQVAHAAHALANQHRREASAARIAKGLPAPPNGLSALVPVWEAHSRPRSSATTEKRRLYAARFDQAIGRKPPALISAADVRRYRDHIEQTYTHANARKHLEAVNALLNAAVSAGAIATNPAQGVKLRRSREPYALRRRREAFTASDMRAIFAALPDAPERLQWPIRLMAYHGCRSGELLQLRRVDVIEVDGTRAIRLTDEEGDMSLKNENAFRVVPLHPACMAFFDWAGSQSGPDVFASFNVWGAQKGRAGHFQKVGGAWLRSIIPEPSKTLHSFRHRWADCARAIGMPEHIAVSITGHARGAGEFKQYGSGPTLAARARWIAQVDPLANV